VTGAELLEAVRAACPRGLWSQGVKLARDGAVRRESATGGEIILRVTASGMAVAATVVLYPGDGEWECDCAGRFDACAHVAAAVIALEHGEGEASAPVAATSALVYHLERASGKLFLRRAIARPDLPEIDLPSSLFGIAAGRAPSHGLAPTQADLELERLIGNAARVPVDADRVRPVLSALATSNHVRLDGQPVTASGDPVLPRGVVTSRGEGVRLAVVADPSVTDIPADRLARCGDVLHPLAHTSVAGERWEALPLVRDYRPEELAELVTTMLPALRQDVEVEIKTRRLPGLTHEARPRIAFAIEGDGVRLSVLPTLVYGDPPLARVDGDKLIQIRPPAPVRDRRAELEVVATLRDRLHMMPGRKVQVSGAEARALAERVRTFQRGDDPDKAPDTLIEVPLVPRFTVHDEPDGDASFDLWFETTGEEADEPRRVSAASVAAAWQHGLELVPLDGGGWAPLPADFLAKHGQRVMDLLAARGERGVIPTVAVPALAALCDDLGAPRPAVARKLAALLGEHEHIPDAPLPAGFRGELRPYQKLGTDWLAFLKSAGFGAVLADDMGLGKTVQALAVLSRRALIVCPTSVLHNWESEIARFRPDLSVSIYHGARRSLDRAADIVLTTYAILRIDRDRLAAERWQALVLDEAQAIKNPDSQSAQAAFGLEADFRMALSGTPIENRLEELWSICHFTNPGLLGGRADFQRRVAGPIAAGRADAAAYLRDKIRPFVLRRLKREVAPELPPRTDQVISVELDEEERAVYDAVRAASRAEIAERLSAGGGVMEALEALLRLRQAACHPALIPGIEPPPISSKITCLVEALETAAADGHKALVFSQWTSLLDLVEPHLTAAGIGFTRLDGSTVDRASVVREFQDDAGPPVLIASLKAGGIGLNLTAADHVFVLDPWWNPAAEDQAADRAHRIGQDKPVMVYRLVARDTVEERILALQQRKRALADVALGQADRAAGLTRADLLALLD
jgi:superfamily II DNA or RNA helicase